MVTSPVLQWALTAVFVAVAMYCVVELVGGHARRAPDHLAHLVMSLDMAAMAWPWWSEVPRAPQLVVFALATAWFTARLFVALGTRWRRSGSWRGWPGAPLRRAATGAARLLGHLADAAMMLAMTWMVAVMGTSMTAGREMASAMAGHQHGMLPPTHVAAGLVLTAAMLATAAGRATGLIETHSPAAAQQVAVAARPSASTAPAVRQLLRARSHPHIATATATAMSAGMALMCWLMVSA